MSSGCLALIVSLIFAMVDWLSVARGRKRLEYVFKPATLLAVLIGAGLLMRVPHDPWQARFFLSGLAFSLVGDVLLMLPGERFFLPGLVAFLLGHLCYVVGFNPTLPPPLSLLMLIPAVVGGVVLYRSIVVGLRRRGESKLLLPVAVYSVVLSLMLLSAWATSFRPAWSGTRRGLAIIGASLFFASDAMLAWDRFVTPIPGGRVWIHATYHLGQIGLAASIALGY